MPPLTRQEAATLAVLRRLLALVASTEPATPHGDAGADFTLILKELKKMSDTFDTEMTKLRNDVAAQSTVIASATEAFRGLAAQLVAAEAAAKNAGATDTQVAALTNLRQQLEVNTVSLAAAVPANTPASDPTPVPTPATTPATASAAAPVVTAPATSSTAAVPPAPPAADAAPLAATTAR